MNASRRPLVPVLVLLVALGAGLVLLLGGGTDAEGGPREDAAMAKARKDGLALWRKVWVQGGKSCATCHDRGPNKLTGARLNGWPKYDRTLRKVATGQEKLNQMITKQCRGDALPIGGAELTALEAYIKSR